LDPNGKLIWQTDELGGSISGTPALSSDGKLFVGTYNSEILALDAANGSVIWRKPVTGWVYGGPLLNNGVLYFGDLSGTFYAKDAATGEDKWQPVQPDTSPNGEISGTPVVVGDTVYFGSKAGILYAYDIATGQKRWDSMQKSFGNNNGKTTLGKLYSPLQAIDNMIYITPMGTGPILIAIDSDGNQKWSFTPSK
jgi:outer membrane protein assembly factor BamB